MVTMFQKDANDVPTQKVIAMRKQGLSDNQIIQSLQHEGYDSQNVLEALEMADMGKTQPDLGGNVPQTPMQQKPQSIAPPPRQDMQNPMTPQSMPPPMQNSSPQQEQKSDDDVEELIEAIIDEKWAEVEKDITRVLEWKENVDERIGAIEENIKNLKGDFNDLHKAIVGKIGDYDKNILSVGTQLKSMEQVFSKVLPTFTDNVAELNLIADKLKKK